MAQNNSSNQLGNKVLDTLSDCIFKVVESKTKGNTLNKTKSSAITGSYTHPLGNAPNKTSGLYKFSTDDTSHIASVTPVTQKDITVLGIAAENHSHTGADISVSSTDLRKLNQIVQQLDQLMEIITVTANGLDLGGKYLDNAVFR